MAGTDEKFCNTTLNVCDCGHTGECVCKVTQACVVVCVYVHVQIMNVNECLCFRWVCQAAAVRSASLAASLCQLTIRRAARSVSVLD